LQENFNFFPVISVIQSYLPCIFYFMINKFSHRGEARTPITGLALEFFSTFPVDGRRPRGTAGADGKTDSSMVKTGKQLLC
jgi:hypothetical protein